MGRRLKEQLAQSHRRGLALDGEKVTLPLPRGHKAQGAQFDRFGVVTQHPGGGLVKVYFDDLQYTAGRQPK